MKSSQNWQSRLLRIGVALIVISFILAYIQSSMSSSSPPSQNYGYLVISSMYGISNQLYAVASGFAVAKLSKRTLIVDWHPQLGEKSLGYTELYEAPILNQLQDFPEIQQIIDAYWVGEMTPVENEIYFHLNETEQWDKIIDASQLVVHISTWKPIIPMNVQLSEFAEIFLNFLKELRPVLPIQQVVDRFQDTKFGSDRVIGVHFRDFNHSNSYSNQSDASFDEYFQEMDKAVKENGSTRFYLAAFSFEAKNLFTEKYRERILSLNLQKFELSSIYDLYYSLVDWYLLSKTEYVIGTNTSTFSETAAILTKTHRFISLPKPVNNATIYTPSYSRKLLLLEYLSHLS